MGFSIALFLFGREYLVIDRILLFESGMSFIMKTMEDLENGGKISADDLGSTFV